MTEIVQFNIGGKLYQISKSLLEMHSNTMLAKSASVNWQKDPEAEIFIERNGIRFQFVLDYLRDGKVTLPVTESKEMLISELEYFGVEYDEEMIDEKFILRSKSLKSISAAMVELQYIIASEDAAHKTIEAQSRIAQYVIDIIKVYVGEGAPSLQKSEFDYYDHFNEAQKSNYHKLGRCFSVLCGSKKKMAETVNNMHLRGVGLQVDAYMKLTQYQSEY
jgi:hypothetical protein